MVAFLAGLRFVGQDKAIILTPEVKVPLGLAVFAIEC
jgi:hypothetical protein